MTAPDPRRVIPEDRLGAVEEVTPITMGMSGAAVFSVKTTKGRFVVRFHVGDPKAWPRAVSHYRRAADAGVAPALVHVDDTLHATVATQIEGVSLGRALRDPAARPALFASLAAQLRTLHAIPCDDLQANDAIDFARRMWGMQHARPGFPAWAVPLAGKLESVARVLAQDPRKAFSHCDLNPANILWDGTRLWLVDWDNAGLAHPDLDLAIITDFLSLPDTVANNLLAATYGTKVDALDAKTVTTFAALRDLARIVYGSAFLWLVPDLQAVTFPISPEAAASLSECFAAVAAGTLAMTSPEGRTAIAAAFYKQALLGL